MTKFRQPTSCNWLLLEPLPEATAPTSVFQPLAPPVSIGKKHMKVYKVASMVPNMKVDMVANMKVDKAADMNVNMVIGKVVNRVAHMVADMDFSIFFWAFLCEIFVFPSDFFKKFGEIF